MMLHRLRRHARPDLAALRLPMLDWFKDHPAITSLIAGGSLLMFVVGIFAMPVIVSRIPADYFAHERRPAGRFASLHWLLRLLLMVFKNLLAVVLLLCGIAMLVLPGQGLLTMLVGFLLLDLPGKYRVERWLVARRWVHQPINWLRSKRGRPPLKLRDHG